MRNVPWRRRALCIAAALLLLLFTAAAQAEYETVYGDGETNSSPFAFLDDLFGFSEDEGESEPASEEYVDNDDYGDESAPDERGFYDQKDDVALYIYTYGRLPDNFITKRDAEKLGWDNHKVHLDDVAPGMSIGGDRFGNYEGTLPDARGRTWTECDIDASEGRRGVKRIVFSSDGLIYYSDDHYKTFERLY